jgi:hypothetical protein
MLVATVASMPHERYKSVQKNGLSMHIDLWFDFFARPKRGSDDRALAFVLLCSFALQLAYAVPFLATAVRRRQRCRIFTDAFITLSHRERRSTPPIPPTPRAPLVGTTSTQAPPYPQGLRGDLHEVSPILILAHPSDHRLTRQSQERRPRQDDECERDGGEHPLNPQLIAITLRTRIAHLPLGPLGDTFSGDSRPDTLP